MKYDWSELRNEFMQGDYLSIFDFYKQHQNRTKTAPKKDMNGQRKKMTKGRAEEKDQMKKQVDNRITEHKNSIEDELKAKMSEELHVDIQELIKQKKALFILINKKIVHLAKNSPENITARDINILLDMVKRELGEPTNLSKNHNIEEKSFIPSEDDLDE
ncbi:MAG: hypothetical protein WCO66_02420 [Candidatus Absconditabacteria bacterium]